MLASKGHVKIGTYEYLLDESIDNHYVHRFEPLFAPKADVSGSPGKQQLRSDKLLWSWDDWVQGEGARIYHAENPFVYDFSFGLNPRIRGQLTGRPARTVDTSSLTTNDVVKRPVLAAGASSLWYAGGYRLGYTTDASSWTVVNSTGTDATDYGQLQSKSSNYAITAAVGDGNWLYYAGWHSGSSGSRILLRRQADNTTVADDVQAEGTGKAPYAGLAIMYGRLYAWTGRRLYELDIFQQGNSYGASALAAADQRKVMDTGVDPASSNVFGTTWWANAITTENSVICFYSSDGNSMVYEYKNGAPRPLWTPPIGFTIKAVKYNDGKVYFSGHWGGDSNMKGRGALYGMSLDSRRPTFIGWFRKQNDYNLEMQEMCASYGSQVMIAASRTGRIFIYDADTDGLSMMDDIGTAGSDSGTEGSEPHITNTDGLSFTVNSHRIGDMLTYGTKRCVIVFFPGSSGSGNYQILTYDDDEPANRQASTSTGDYSAPIYSGKWDFDFPHATKALMGFHVVWKVENSGTTSGLKVGQEIKVEYALDDDAWVTAATITSSTTPTQGVQGRTFVAVSNASSTKKFYVMRTRLTLYGKRVSSTNYQPPVVYSFTTEGSLMEYAETWDLILRVKDESGDSGYDRISSRMWKGSTARDYLEDLAQNKAVVTLLDGYRYQRPGSYTTHTVTIEDPVDIIDRNAEGSYKVKLRAVPI